MKIVVNEILELVLNFNYLGFNVNSDKEANISEILQRF
jgi:hypothetical protein